MTVDSVTVNEDADTITVDVTLNAAVEGGFNVDAVLADVTTASGDTISTSPQTLTFTGNAGEVQTVTLTIVDDNIVEFTESLQISLDNLVVTSAPASAIDISSVGTVAIEDNDEAVVTLTPDVTDASEQPDGTGVTNGEFTLALSNPSSTATIVNFDATPDPSSSGIFGAIREGFETSGLAHLQGDYRILANGVEVTGNTFTIPAGVTEVDITIEVIDDVVVELTENFDLNLTTINSAHPEIEVGSPTGGNVTITDDDQAEIVVKAIQDANEPGQTAGDNGFFQVLLVVPGSVDSDNPNGIPAPVSYDIQVLFSVTGTANQIPGDSSNPVDFEELESVQFAAGETIDVIAVTPEDDLLLEGDETVTLTLSPNTVSSVTLDNLFTDPDDNVTEVFVTSNLDHNSATVTIVDNEVLEVGGVFANAVGPDGFAPQFRDFVDGGLGDGNSRGVELTDPLETLPYVNLNELVIQVNGPVDAATLQLTDFALTGQFGITDSVASDVATIISAVPGPNNTILLGLSEPLQANEYQLDILGTQFEALGTAGVDSTITFRVLPGDVIQDSTNTVVTGDVFESAFLIGEQLLPTGPTANYSIRADINGDNVINLDDVFAATFALSDQLIFTSPVTQNPFGGSSRSLGQIEHRDNRVEFARSAASESKDSLVSARKLQEDRQVIDNSIEELYGSKEKRQTTTRFDSSSDAKDRAFELNTDLFGE